MKIHEYNIFWNGMNKQYKPNARFNYCNIMNVYKSVKRKTHRIYDCWLSDMDFWGMKKTVSNKQKIDV